MVYVFYAILIFGLFVLARDWRYGLMFCLVVGFLQDPLRKLVPGHPGVLQALVMIYFILVCASLLRGFKWNLVYPVISADDHRLEGAWKLFFAIVLLQVVHTALRTSNPAYAIMGSATYMAPAIAIFVGSVFVTDLSRLLKFLRLYMWISIPVGLSIYLSYWYSEQWDILKEIGELAGGRLIIYDVGAILYSYSGVMRTGEIAAWHAATACMCLSAYAVLSRKTINQVFAGLLIGILIGAILLTGRRKMLMTLSIYAGVFSFLLIYYWQGARRLAAITLIAGMAAAAFVFTQGQDEGRALYTERGGTVYESIDERWDTSVQLFRSAYNRGGFFGFGVGAQGGRYVGGQTQGIGGSAEAGGGKMMVELGVPGVLLAMYLLWRIFRHLQRVFTFVPARYTTVTVLFSAITAFQLANIGTFLVATQIYGDSFILLMIGLMAGFLFGLERLVVSEIQQQQQILPPSLSRPGDPLPVG